MTENHCFQFTILLLFFSTLLLLLLFTVIAALTLSINNMKKKCLGHLRSDKNINAFALHSAHDYCVSVPRIASNSNHKRKVAV